MKRKLIACIATLALGAMLVPAAFAASENNQPTNPAPNQQFFNQMFDWHNNWLDNAVKNGQLTEDQANAWRQHFDQMRNYHNQYGYGMMGNCFGSGYGMMGNSGSQSQ